MSTDAVFGVVVVSYFSADLVRELMDECAWLEDVCLVVVDNSADPSETQALTECATDGRRRVEVITSPTNVGFGSAVNLGVDRLVETGVDVALLLNPDARIERDDVDRLRAIHAGHPGALVSPVIADSQGRPWFEGGSLDWVRGRAAHTDRAPTDWLTAACLLVPLKPFRRLGGFDPSFFMYWEDVDLSVRWAEAGGELIVARAARACHLVGGTQGSRRGKSPLYVEYNCRNRLRFASKHLPTLGDRARWTLSTYAYARLMLGRAAVETPAARWAARRAVIRGTTRGLVALVIPHRWRVRHV